MRLIGGVNAPRVTDPEESSVGSQTRGVDGMPSWESGFCVCGHGRLTGNGDKG